MTPEEAAALRAPFPPEAIGKLPRIICPACSKSPTKVCGEHGKVKCPDCGNYITTRHIHLDYVGHAGVRDRLLQVDPEWTWEPAAVDPSTGAPVCTDGGLWIRMTVCGVTRLGWGDGPDIKQRISDAIRNAAMTFGVALDLWSKEDLHANENAEEAETSGKSGLRDERQSAASSAIAPRGAATPQSAEPASPAGSADSHASRRAALKSAAIALEAAGKPVKDAIRLWQLPKIDECDEKQLALYDELFHDLDKDLFNIEATV